MPKRRFLEGKPVIIKAVSELIFSHLSETVYSKFKFEESNHMVNSVDISLKGLAYDGSSKSYMVGWISLRDDSLTVNGPGNRQTSLLYADPGLEDGLERELITIFSEACKKLSRDKAAKNLAANGVRWGMR